LVASVFALILAGSFSLNVGLFEVGITVAFGAIGYIMKRLEYPPAPLVLALVLGHMLENSFRQSMIMSRGDISIFFTRPISLILIVIAVAAVVIPAIRSSRRGSISRT
jgi:putative tricarboxylic transport membrane protein